VPAVGTTPAFTQVNIINPLGQGTCTLEQYGAVGDNVTNDSAALTAALASGCHTLILGSKIYYTPGTFTVPSGMAILGQGWSSGLRSDSNATILNCQSINDWVFDGFKVIGNGGSSQWGIKVGTVGTANSGSTRGVVSRIFFDTVGGSGGGGGFYFAQNPFVTYMGVLVSDCIARTCGTGFYFGDRGEYCAVANCSAESCTVGAEIVAGNIGWVGGALTANTTNLKLTAGSNDSHGSMTGVKINHAITNALVAGAITQGFTFSDCHFYDGQFNLTNSVGCHFVNCIVDCAAYNFNGSAGTVFLFPICPSSYANTITDSNSPDTHWFTPKNLSGNTPSFLGSRSAFLDADNSGNTYVGTDKAFSQQSSTLRLYAASSGYLGIASTAICFWDANGFYPQKPITGGGISNYGLHGVGTQAMADANQTPAASVYQYHTIKPTGAITANRNLVLPACTDAASVIKWIDNECTGAFSVVVGDGGAGTTATVANGAKAAVLFDSRGATLLLSVGGAVNLAGGSSSVTGNLPITNIAPGTDGQFLGNVSGTNTWGSTATCYTTKASNPATVGLLRGATTTTLVAIRKADNSADKYVIDVDGSDNQFFGSSTSYTNQANAVRVVSATGTYLSVGSTTYVLCSSSEITLNQFAGVAVTIGGSVVVPNPFAYKTATIASASTVTLSTAQYTAVQHIWTGSTACTATYPNITGAHYVVKITSTQPVTIQKSGGLGATITNNKASQVCHDGTDYYHCAAEVSYP